MKEINLKIETHCVSCVVNIEKILKKHIIKIEINPVLKIAKIKYDPNHITKEKIIKKIKGIGYKSYEIEK